MKNVLIIEKKGEVAKLFFFEHLDIFPLGIQGILQAAALLPEGARIEIDYGYICAEITEDTVKLSDPEYFSKMAAVHEIAEAANIKALPIKHFIESID